MNVLVIGRGAREHSIAWKLSNSSKVKKVYVAPGNDGIINVAIPLGIDESNIKDLIAFVKKEDIHLTLVGSEVPLMNGIVNEFEKENLCIFGPTKEAAKIEGSKSFAKELMIKYNIPTAAYKVFTKYKEAHSYISKSNLPIVIKADGLAAGKGVIIANTQEEAIEGLNVIMGSDKLGSLNSKVVIEEFLEGEEFSFMSFINEEKIYPMAISKDYKRAYDNNKGLNTGGMGAYSPVDGISDKIVMECLEKIINPTAKAMVREGFPFRGVLYAGLILTKNGPKVIEYNARFGDPETEVVLPRMENDLYDVISHVLSKKELNLKWSNDYAIGVVLASKGYPSTHTVGSEIRGLDSLDDIMVFHAGTKYIKNTYVTNGGRVLLLGSKGKTLEEARKKVYDNINKIKCDNLFYRKDIGSNI